MACTGGTKAHGGASRFYRVGDTQMYPVFDREVVECQQDAPILGGFLDHFGTFRGVISYETLKGRDRFFVCRRYPDFLQCALRPCMLQFARCLQPRRYRYR